MSDTPRTDAMIQPVPGRDCVTGDPIQVVHADDCRELEREFAKAQKDADRWAVLPLLHPMDIATEVMGSTMPQDLRRGLERRVDELIAKVKNAAPQVPNGSAKRGTPPAEAAPGFTQGPMPENLEPSKLKLDTK